MTNPAAAQSTSDLIEELGELMGALRLDPFDEEGLQRAVDVCNELARQLPVSSNEVERQAAAEMVLLTGEGLDESTSAIEGMPHANADLFELVGEATVYIKYELYSEAANALAWALLEIDHGSAGERREEAVTALSPDAKSTKPAELNAETRNVGPAEDDSDVWTSADRPKVRRRRPGGGPIFRALRSAEDCEGPHLFVFYDTSSEPVAAFVATGGQVCFGVVLGGRNFIDPAFTAAAPELAEVLAKTPHGDLEPLTIAAGKNGGDRAREELLGLMARAFLEIEALHSKPIRLEVMPLESFEHAITFRPAELLLAIGQARVQPEVDVVSRLYDALSDAADESCLLASTADTTPFSVESQVPRDSIERHDALAELAVVLSSTLRKYPGELVEFLGIDEDGFWHVALNGRHTSIGRFPIRALGRNRTLASEIAAETLSG